VVWDREGMRVIQERKGRGEGREGKGREGKGGRKEEEDDLAPPPKKIPGSAFALSI
jgi:hypothetical protein